VGARAGLPKVVARAELFDGNAKLIIGEGGVKIGGPAAAGALVHAFGASLALVADAACAGLAAALVAGVGPGAARESDGTRAGGAAAIGAGFRFVWRHPLLRPIAAINVLGNLGAAIVDGVVVVFAYRQLGLTPAVFGVTLAAGGIGFLASALAAKRVSRRLGAGRTLAATSLLFALAYFVLPLGVLGAPMAAIAGWRFLLGLSLPAYDVTAASIRQVATPDHLQGRVIGSINAVGWGALGVGPLAGGLLAERIGLTPTVLLGAAVCLAGALPTAARPLFRLRGFPGAPRPAASPAAARLP
jgi:hypothetical protein